MGKSKEVSQDCCNLIVAKHNDGIGYRCISKLLNAPVSTVGAIIQKWKEYNFTVNGPRPNASRNISDRGVKRIKKKSEELSKSQGPQWRASEIPGIYSCLEENNK